MQHQTLFLLYVLGHAFVYLQKVIIVGSESCPQSIPTYAIVESCPEDSAEWIRASDKKQCNLISHNCTQKNNFQYHCLPNRHLNKLIEVCTPTTVIVGQHCPYYDMERNVIEPNFNQPCNSHSEPCAEVYSSSVTYKFQECYNDITEKKTRPASPDSKVLVEVSDSYPELAIGIYVISAILVVIMILFVIRIYCLHPCCGKCPFKGKYECNKNKDHFEKDEEDRSLEETSMAV